MTDRYTDRISDSHQRSHKRLTPATPTYGRTDGLTKKVVPLREMSCVSNAREFSDDRISLAATRSANRYAVAT